MSKYTPNLVRVFTSADDAIEFIGFGWFNIRLVILLGAVQVLYAIEWVVLSILGPALRCEWNISFFQQSLVSTVVFAGILVGSITWGWLTDRVGRKLPLQIGSMIGLAGSVASALAPAYRWLLLFRFLVGFAIGGVPQVGTMLVEFTPTRQRALVIVTMQAFFGIGSAYAAGLAVLVMPSLGWRWFVFLCGLPMLLFVFVSFLIEESVSYQVLCGRVAEASCTLQRIFDLNRAHPRIWWRNDAWTAAMAALHHEVDTLEVRSYNLPDETERGNLLNLFVPKYRLTTLLLWVTWVGSSFTYVGIVLMSTELLNAGALAEAVCRSDAVLNATFCAAHCALSTSDYIALLWTSTGELFGFVWPLLAVEWLGRRATISICLALFSGFIIPLLWPLGRIMTVVTLLLARSFNEATSVVQWVYTPEVYPTSIRGVGLGATLVVECLSQGATPFVAQWLAQDNKRAALVMYVAVAAAGAIAAAFLPIETRGRRLHTRVNEPEDADECSPLTRDGR